MRLIPRQPVPELSIGTVSGGRWTLSENIGTNFLLLVFYRGTHCPLCRGYMRELDALTAEFGQRGTTVFALSSDTRERAAQAREQWGLANLDPGCGLPLSEARRWGLYVSTGRGKTSIGIEEPAQFSEPGIFLVRPDRTLYWAQVQTMPFARPHFRDILAGLDFVIRNDYPARGEA